MRRNVLRIIVGAALFLLGLGLAGEAGKPRATVYGVVTVVAVTVAISGGFGLAYAGVKSVASDLRKVPHQR